MNLNQTRTEAARGSGVPLTYGPNFWRKTGHCNRCNNGQGHTPRRRDAGGSSGVSLGPLPGRHVYTDDLAPGEKKHLRRAARARGRADLARAVAGR